MKIEAGKKYLTRDGHIARIYATDGKGSMPVHGAVWLDETNHWSMRGRPEKECWYMIVWSAEGYQYNAPFSRIEGHQDLVSEYHGPVSQQAEEGVLNTL